MPEVDCICNGTNNYTCGQNNPCIYGCKNDAVIGRFCDTCVAWFDAQDGRISHTNFGTTGCQQPGCEFQVFPFKTPEGEWCVNYCCWCYLKLLCSKCKKLEPGPYTDGVCAQCTQLRCGLCPSKLVSTERDICATCEARVIRERGHCFCANDTCRNRPIVYVRSKRKPVFVFCEKCHNNQTAQQDSKITCVIAVCTEPACASGYCYSHSGISEEKTKPCPTPGCIKRVLISQDTVCVLCEQKDEQAKRCEESRKAEELHRLAKLADSDDDELPINDGSCGYRMDGSCNGNCGCW